MEQNHYDTTAESTLSSDSDSPIVEAKTQMALSLLNETPRQSSVVLQASMQDWNVVAGLRLPLPPVLVRHCTSKALPSCSMDSGRFLQQLGMSLLPAEFSVGSPAERHHLR